MSPTAAVTAPLPAVLLAVLLAGCASSAGSEGASGPADTSASMPSASGSTATAGPGFAPATPPPPAGTFTPDPGSWTGADPRPGYRVVLVTTDQSRPTQVLSAAVTSWAAEVGADLDVLVADHPHHYVARIQQAIDEHADLVVCTGDGLVDPLALVTASNLDQQFLVVGAELAEPTLNVTAADWDGAAFRGEGLGRSSAYDPASFTPARAGRAIRAGVAAVLTGLGGTVVRVD